MEIASLRMAQWLGVNERYQVSPTDRWYLDFANKLYPIVKKSPYFSASGQRKHTEAAMSLSMYLQDAIAQTGGWKVFTESYYPLYNSYLPFYRLTDSYVPDEINMEDIAFILWTLKSNIAIFEHTYTLQDPYDQNLLNLAKEVYELMDYAFEEAPICEESSSFLWVMGPESFDIEITPLPEITPDTKLTEDVKRCLEYSNGKPLLYFTTYKELKAFLVDVLKWDSAPSSLLPELEAEKEFVIYANAKGMLVAHNVASYFCEAHNPMYSAKRAEEKGYTMFCVPGVCPFDLLKYGMMKGLLPDLQLPFANGKETLQKNWDFIARYYLGEYYEGV